MAQERTSELEDISMEIFKTEKQSTKTEKNTKNRICKNCKKCYINVMRIPEEEDRKKGAGEILETIKTKNFPN